MLDRLIGYGTLAIIAVAVLVSMTIWWFAFRGLMGICE